MLCAGFHVAFHPRVAGSCRSPLLPLATHFVAACKWPKVRDPLQSGRGSLTHLRFYTASYHGSNCRPVHCRYEHTGG